MAIKEYYGGPSDALFDDDHVDKAGDARLRRQVEKEVASLRPPTPTKKKKPVVIPVVANTTPKRSPLKTAVMRKATPRKPFAPFGGRVRRALKTITSPKKKADKMPEERRSAPAMTRTDSQKREDLQRARRKKLASRSRLRGRFR